MSQASAILIGESIYMIPGWTSNDDDNEQRIDLDGDEVIGVTSLGGASYRGWPVLFHVPLDFCVDN